MGTNKKSNSVPTVTQAEAVFAGFVERFREANLIDPLTRFQEASQSTTRDRKLSRRIRPLQRKIAAGFQAQGKDFLSRLSRLAGKFDNNAERKAASEAAGITYVIRPSYHILHEAIKTSDWSRLWTGTIAKTTDLFTDPLGDAILDALILGGGDLMTGLGLTAADMEEFGIAWNLQNPEAVEYAREHAAEQVTKINDTTRSGINSIIVRAVDEGWSYDRVSGIIGERFEEFATGGKNPRSRRVAIFELGDSYEAATEILGKKLTDAGLKMEQKWLTVGDARVRPSHRDNEKQGWIPFADDFSSGDSRPPTDGGCRCSRLIRRARSG